MWTSLEGGEDRRARLVKRKPFRRSVEPEKWWEFKLFTGVVPTEKGEFWLREEDKKFLPVTGLKQPVGAKAWSLNLGNAHGSAHCYTQINPLLKAQKLLLAWEDGVDTSSLRLVPFNEDVKNWYETPEPDAEVAYEKGAYEQLLAKYMTIGFYAKDFRLQRLGGRLLMFTAQPVTLDYHNHSLISILLADRPYFYVVVQNDRYKVGFSSGRVATASKPGTASSSRYNAYRLSDYRRHWGDAGGVCVLIAFNQPKQALVFEAAVKLVLNGRLPAAGARYRPPWVREDEFAKWPGSRVANNEWFRGEHAKMVFSVILTVYQNGCSLEDMHDKKNVVKRITAEDAKMMKERLVRGIPGVTDLKQYDRLLMKREVEATEKDTEELDLYETKTKVLAAMADPAYLDSGSIDIYDDDNADMAARLGLTEEEVVDAKEEAMLPPELRVKKPRRRQAVKSAQSAVLKSSTGPSRRGTKRARTATVRYKPDTRTSMSKWGKGYGDSDGECEN